jgi:hypothetical protein
MVLDLCEEVEQEFDAWFCKRLTVSDDFPEIHKKYHYFG